MLAASHEFGDPLVKILLDKGARVNDRDSQGDNALLIAAGNYLPKIVRLLLEKGADVNARDKDGNTVLMRAAGSRRSWREDREPMFDMLLAAGADPKPANTRGVTALMLAAQEGNPGVLGLLERKVRVDARDSGGNTALLYATRMFVGHGQRAAGRALLAAGADVNAANLDGETPLIRAATQYEEECAEILLERGANVNSRTQQGRTPLIAAIDGPKDFDNTNHLVYSPKIARLLIARGADVNARDAAGRTPLLLAVMRGHADIIPVLLEHKADVNVVDRNGDTVLTLAGSNEVIALLKKAGAK
jgi:ankyrin repeat protein